MHVESLSVLSWLFNSRRQADRFNQNERNISTVHVHSKRDKVYKDFSIFGIERNVLYIVEKEVLIYQ